MPRNVRHVGGPSRLCSATGTPKAAHESSSIASTCAHCGDPAGPTMIKSSGSWNKCSMPRLRRYSTAHAEPKHER